MKYVIAYDVGTTAVKTCLFKIEKNIELVASASQGYGLHLLENGGAEQDVDEWWRALCVTTKKIFSGESVTIKSSDIAGISFCSQMQGLVLVDRNGIPVRPAMSYMDQRAKDEIKKGMQFGVQVAGANIYRLLKSIILTGAASISVKDPMWKYKWVQAHEPENFKRAYKWLDVKEYLICRCTGQFVMTEDSAFSTLLYDTRKGKEGWCVPLCRMFGIDMNHLPSIIKSTDKAGGLTAVAADDLGLTEGTPVFGGGGDATLIGIGAGCTAVGETHIYSGTSGWVSTITDHQVVDAVTGIAAIVGAQHGKFNYFAEMETAGKCFEWVRDHMALDEIGIYLKKQHVAEGHEAVATSLYDYMTQTVKTSPAGAGGVIFTPWLHGNRCPFEDPSAAGIFFNIKLETGKTEMIRAVLEGICYHLRWMVECENKKVKTSATIRFVGGGALSPVICQILADVTGCTIETVANPQNVGAVGAAAVVCAGLGIINSLDEVKKLIPAVSTYIPDRVAQSVYNRNYQVFKLLYKANKNNFARLNT